MVNLAVAGAVSFRDIKKYLLTAASEADIDDSICENAFTFGSKTARDRATKPGLLSGLGAKANVLHI